MSCHVIPIFIYIYLNVCSATSHSTHERKNAMQEGFHRKLHLTAMLITQQSLRSIVSHGESIELHSFLTILWMKKNTV